MCPIMTDLNAAPANVLKFICCNCKSSNKNQHGTNQCSRHKSGLKCVSACKDCRPDARDNKSTTLIEDEVENVDDIA